MKDIQQKPYETPLLRGKNTKSLIQIFGHEPLKVMGQGLPSEPGLDLLDPGCHLVDPGVDAGEVRLAAADAPGDHAHLLPRVAVAHHHRAAAVALQRQSRFYWRCPYISSNRTTSHVQELQEVL